MPASTKANLPSVRLIQGSLLLITLIGACAEPSNIADSLDEGTEQRLEAELEKLRPSDVANTGALQAAAARAGDREEGSSGQYDAGISAVSLYAGNDCVLGRMENGHVTVWRVTIAEGAATRCEPDRVLTEE